MRTIFPRTESSVNIFIKSSFTECCFRFELFKYFSPQITPTIEDPDVFKDIERQVEKVWRRHAD